jgi:hypothetical protein
MLVLESLLRDHGSDASPREELLRLLGSGSLSAAMHQFLSSTLGARPPRHVAPFFRRHNGRFVGLPAAVCCLCMCW